MKMKRLVTLLLSCVILFSVNVPALAVDTETTKSKLEAILEEYPNGSYFSVNGAASNHSSKTGCNNCSLKGILASKNINLADPGRNCWTCWAFVRYVSLKIYGSESLYVRSNAHPNGLNRIASGSTSNPTTFSNAQVGDIIWFYNNSSCTGTPGHMGILMGKTSNGILLYDNNIGGTSQKIGYIRYGEVNYGSEMPRDYCAIYRPGNAVNSPVDTKLSFSNLTTPGNLTEGQSGHVNGYIYSTNSPICSVTAEVYNESGQRKLSAASSGFSVSQYGPIKNSKIDSSLKFGTLPAGTYYIKYTAKALDGTTATAKTESFTVAGEAAPAPVATKITFENLSTPGKLTEGQDGHIGGRIYSSNSPIDYIKFNVYTKNGQLQSSGQTVKKISAVQYSLKDSVVDISLNFEKFSAGDYYIQYTAVTEDGTSATATTNTFTIVPKPATTTNEDQPEWGPWSDWSTTPVQATATRQVETRTVKVSDAKTQYRYGRFVANGHDCWCRTYLESLGYGKASLDYSAWSDTRYSKTGKDWSCGYCRGIHTGVHHTGSDGRDWWTGYRSPSGANYYWEETRTVPAVYETQYRYRDQIN